jgi:hypothetical protein
MQKGGKARVALRQSVSVAHQVVKKRRQQPEQQIRYATETAARRHL